MPRKSRQIFRLPSLNLLFLALVLSGGGFFWHATHQQQLLNRWDSQVLTTARHIDYFSTRFVGKNNPQSLCDSLPELQKIDPGTSEIALYLPTGKLICSSALNPETAVRKSITPSKSVEFETRADSQGYVRSIIYPVQSGKYFLREGPDNL